MSKTVERLRLNDRSWYQTFAVRSFALFALLTLAFGIVLVWLPLSAHAQTINRWGPWQRMVSSDSSSRVEIQFLPPEHLNKEENGTWYYRVRNTSVDQGVCLQFILSVLDSDVQREIKVDVRLKPGEQQKSWDHNQISARRIISLRTIRSDQYENGMCFHRTMILKLNPSDELESWSYGEVGDQKDVAMNLQQECGSMVAYGTKGMINCASNDEVRTSCKCPGGMLLELQFPERMTICHCPSSSMKWNMSRNICTERSMVCFFSMQKKQQSASADLQGEDGEDSSEVVPEPQKRDTATRKSSNRSSESHQSEVCVVNRIHPAKSCTCPSGTSEASLPQGRGLCHCTAPGTIWLSSKNSCVSGVE